MTATDTLASPAMTAPAPSPARGALRRRVLAHRGLVAGLAVLGLILAAAALAPLLAPHDPYRQALMERLVQPVWYADGSWNHPLGTDHLGRDYLSRLLYGAQVSLLIGFATALLSGLIGTTLGVCAG
ncbi:MAG TPA: ABC transporter permease, partial [Azospirillum sp.]|nr:ABC transporter permease [Azospirillum sp.]